MSQNQLVFRVMSPTRRGDIINVITGRNTFSRELEEKKIQVSGLEDIVGVIGDLLVSFLSREDNINLLSSSKVLNKYYFIPLDLSNLDLMFRDFKSYFEHR